jgi:hypothetical protein
LFGFCITHILITGCAKIKKKIRRQKVKTLLHYSGDNHQYILKTKFINSATGVSCPDSPLLLHSYNMWRCVLVIKLHIRAIYEFDTYKGRRSVWGSNRTLTSWYHMEEILLLGCQ